MIPRAPTRFDGFDYERRELNAEIERLSEALKTIQMLGEEGKKADYTNWLTFNGWLTFHDTVAKIAREALDGKYKSMKDHRLKALLVSLSHFIRGHR